MTLIIKITITTVRQSFPFFALALFACTSPRPVTDAGLDDGGTAVNRGQVLAAGGTCVLAQAKTFQTAVVALENVLKAQPVSFADARAAFHVAMDAWQVNEVMQIGPASSSMNPGGGDLRDQIYAWPLTSRCATEETLVAKGYVTNIAAQLINRRGLAAVEYLLFYEGSATACPASSPIVANGTWAALSQTEREERRWAYALAATIDVRLRADALVQKWEGGFQATLTSAGPSNGLYKTQLAAINAMSNALFYVEHEVKDMKLARPIGLRGCATPPCLDLLESQHAARSKANVKANLDGFRRIFQGCQANHEGPGFDDLLISVGADAMSARMIAAADASETALAAIEEADLGPALTTDPASVRALYDAIKAMTDILKTEVPGVLDLEVPKSLEGDND